MCYIKNCQRSRVYEGFKRFWAKKRLIIAVPAKGNLKGVRTKEIAAYIGDLESTTEKYYIAVRKKRVVEGKVQQIVELPEAFQTEEKGSKLPDASST